jgi:OmpR-family two-component system manganese-sensing response regulator
MGHPHQVLTHEQVYEAVWGPDAKPGSNVLAAQMRLLRRKIEPATEPVLIHTVYGKGYRFGTLSEAQGIFFC